MKPLVQKTLEIAYSRIGVREIGRSNTGPEVNRYLELAGVGVGNPWCAGFTYANKHDAAEEVCKYLHDKIFSFDRARTDRNRDSAPDDEPAALSRLVVRINGSGFKDARGNFVSSYIVQGLNACAGFPDVLSLRRTRFLLIEVKKPGGKVSPAQQRFHDFAARFGVDIHVLRDVNALNALLDD